VTHDEKQNIDPSERPWLRPMVTALAVIASLSLAGAIEPLTRAPKPAIRHAAGQPNRRTDKLSLLPVIGRGNQPDLSPELLHDLPMSSNDTTREEANPLPASAVAPPSGPFLRGIYTGAARTLAQSNGKSRIVWLEVTAYCPCVKCCGPDAVGVTASGKPVAYNGGAFVAADADLFPFGAKLSIPGYHDGNTVEVIDRGSAIKGAKVDIFFPTHEQAEEWGRQWVAVKVEETR
jgi:3D (Asp-Asp-Asp) domain-containing protein